MRSLLTLLLTTATAMVATAQVTLTADDMFSVIGQNYRAWSSSSLVDVTGVAGPGGADQLWNFREGPTDMIVVGEIVDPATGGYGGDFPTAQWSEVQGEENQPPDARWFYRLDAGGITNLGAWSTLISPTEPSLPLNPPITEYPLPLEYGDNWSGSGEFLTNIEVEGASVDVMIELTANNQVDGWGTLLLPFTAGSCLRVDRQLRYDIYTEVWGIWILLDTYFMRNYIWLLENRGLAAQLVTEEAASPPPADFTQAHFVRQLETNHPGGEPDPVVNLSAEYSDAGILLSWSSAEGAACYRVESCTAADFTGELTVLGHVYEPGYLDSDYATASQRFYRVISLN